MFLIPHSFQGFLILDRFSFLIRDCLTGLLIPGDSLIRDNFQGFLIHTVVFLCFICPVSAMKAAGYNEAVQVLRLLGGMVTSNKNCSLVLET
jgi:hypothetical protein